MNKLLADNADRFVLFPIDDHEIWKQYKDMEASFWTAQEIDLGKDRFDELTENEQAYIKTVLAFFAVSDGIVNENLAVRFMQEVQLPELRTFYGFQIMMENIHSETYSLLIDTYIKDQSEKKRLFQSIEHYDSIKQKADWMLRWIGSDASFMQRCLAFAIVEGVFFSSSFASIFWLKKQGKMPGLCFSNELISRDEASHTKMACYLFNSYGGKNEMSVDNIHAMFREAVELESSFVEEALKVDLIGMNSKLMIQYVQYVADYLLGQLNIAPLYNVENPFEFMNMISMDRMTNFFEGRVAEYARPNTEFVFDMNETF